MLFCPTCGTLLLTEKTVSDFRFFCQTCPYIYVVEKTYSKQLTLERKQVDDVLGGAEAWENADKTAIVCSK